MIVCKTVCPVVGVHRGQCSGWCSRICMCVWGLFVAEWSATVVLCVCTRYVCLCYLLYCDVLNM